MNMIHARVGLQQRVLPEYRAEFFDTLATACLKGLGVFAGGPCQGEAVEVVDQLSIAHYTHARNLHFFRGSAYFYWQAGVLSWLQRWQPDVLIMEINPRNRSNPLAARWMKERGRPVLGWGLGLPGAGKIYRLIYQSLLRSCDAVIAYSTTAALQYRHAGVDPSRVFVAANAVTRRPTDLVVARPPSFHENTPQLLFVGRLQPRKRVDTLLYALAMLPPHQQPRLSIIGDGPDRSRLEMLAWQVYPLAVFHGAKRGQELDPYYQDADLFILPGTGGLAIQQAMAHALPVIVGAADGTQIELVREENGWTLPDDSPETLARVIREALSDVERLRQKGLASRRIVSEEVNLEAMVKTFCTAVESVL